MMSTCICKIIRLLELEVLSAFKEVTGNCNKAKIISMTIMNMQDHQIVESLLRHTVLFALLGKSVPHLRVTYNNNCILVNGLMGMGTDFPSEAKRTV